MIIQNIKISIWRNSILSLLNKGRDRTLPVYEGLKVSKLCVYDQYLKKMIALFAYPLVTESL